MAANLIPQVLEYLSKKGYSRTEAMLRKESAHTDANGQIVPTKFEDSGKPFRGNTTPLVVTLDALVDGITAAFITTRQQSLRYQNH